MWISGWMAGDVGTEIGDTQVGRVPCVHGDFRRDRQEWSWGFRLRGSKAVREAGMVTHLFGIKDWYTTMIDCA